MKSFVFFLISILFLGCYSNLDTQDKKEVNQLSLDVSQNEIVADGLDTVYLSVKVKDENGNDREIYKYDLYIDGVKRASLNELKTSSTEKHSLKLKIANQETITDSNGNKKDVQNYDLYVDNVKNSTLVESKIAPTLQHSLMVKIANLESNSSVKIYTVQANEFKEGDKRIVPGFIKMCDISPDEKHILSLYRSNYISIFNMDGKLQYTITPQPNSVVKIAKFVNDTQLLIATATTDKDVVFSIIDFNGKIIRSTKALPFPEIYSADLSFDRTLTLVRVKDPTSSTKILVLNNKDFSFIKYSSLSGMDYSVSKDNKFLFYYDDGDINSFNFATYTTEEAISYGNIKEIASYTKGFAYVPIKNSLFIGEKTEDNLLSFYFYNIDSNSTTSSISLPYTNYKHYSCNTTGDFAAFYTSNNEDYKGIVTLVNLITGEKQDLFFGFNKDNKYDVYYSVFSANYFLTGSDDGSLRLFDIKTNTLKSPIFDESNHFDAVKSIAASPDGKYIATGSSDKTIKIWSTADKSYVKTLYGNDYSINAVKFSYDADPNNCKVASFSLYSEVKVWNVSTGICEYTLPNSYTQPNHSRALGFSKVYNYLAVGILNSIYVYDSNTGNLLKRLPAPFKNGYNYNDEQVIDLDFSTDGKYLAAVSNKGTVMVFDVASETITVLSRTEKEFSQLKDASVIKFSSDSQKICVGGNNIIDVYNVLTGKLDFSLGSVAFSDTSNNATSLIMSLDFTTKSNLLISCSQSGFIKIWDLPARQCVFSKYYDTSKPTVVNFINNYKEFVCGFSDGSLSYWSKK